MISLGNAISSLREDKKWIYKCVIGGIIAYVIPFLVGFAMGLMGIEENSTTSNVVIYTMSFIVGVYVCGFVYTSMNRVMNSSEPFQMANWNEKNLMLTGIKAMLSFFVWGILLMLISIIALLLVAGIAALFFMLVSKLTIDMMVVQILFIIFALVLGSILGLYLAQFINNGIACYCKTLRLKDLIAFKKHYRMIKENKHENWTLIGKNILSTMLILLITLALCVTMAGVVLIPVVFFAFYFVMYNLIAQYAKVINIDKYLA